MEFNFKKLFFWVAVMVGGVVYVQQTYTFGDVLACSHKYPHADISPAIDYYVGLVGYLRSDYKAAEQAFQQVLTDYPTSYYASYAMYRLGSVYCEQVRWGDAREIYEKYMSDYPEGEKIDYVRNRHEHLKFR